MRALGFTEHGGLELVGFVEVPEPSPAEGEVRVRIKAAAFNRLDHFVLAGIPGVPIERPHALGSDGAGVVDRCGAGVTDFAPGQRVLLNPGLWDGTCEECRRGEEARCRNFRILGEHTQGSAAPFVVLPARNVHAIPEHLSFEAAAAAPLVFQTAWRALLSVGQLQPGETVALIGAGGGVSTAAVQIAKRFGGRVVIATRSPAKAERARSLGADDVLVFDEAHPLDKVLWEWSGKRGVDVILDSVGQPTLPKSLRATARGGRVIVIGATAGPVVELDVRTLFWRQASIRGSTMASAAEFRAMLVEFLAGRLRPVVDRVFPWEDGVAAFHRTDAPDLFGKVVLRVGPD